MIQIIHDYIVLELDRIFDVKETPAGLITLNEAWIEPKERDRNIYKRIHGTIVSVPRGYSDLKIEPLEPGLPEYKLFIGHDTIQDRANEGYSDWSRETHYHPGSKDSYEFKTMQDVGQFIDVKIGDKCYVHPNQLEEENALFKHNDKYYFRIRIDEILCVVRDGQIITQGQRVILKPHMETQDEIMRSGMQIKAQAEAKPLQGFVVSARTEFCPKGILVFFMEDANWLITIEEQAVFCLKEEEIFCWVKAR